jgi:hypothetical protein
MVEREKGTGEPQGRTMTGPEEGFWQGKTPCWEMVHCPETIRSQCPASKGHPAACWEIEGTYCKLPSGQDTSTCEVCVVYKRWGGGKPITIKVTGPGIGIETTTPPAIRYGGS